MTFHTTIAHTTQTGRDDGRTATVRSGHPSTRHLPAALLSRRDLRRIVAEMLD